MNGPLIRLLLLSQTLPLSLGLVSILLFAETDALIVWIVAGELVVFPGVLAYGFMSWRKGQVPLSGMLVPLSGFVIGFIFTGVIVGIIVAVVAFIVGEGAFEGPGMAGVMVVAALLAGGPCTVFGLALTARWAGRREGRTRPRS